MTLLMGSYVHQLAARFKPVNSTRMPAHPASVVSIPHMSDLSVRWHLRELRGQGIFLP